MGFEADFVEIAEGDLATRGFDGLDGCCGGLGDLELEREREFGRADAEQLDAVVEFVDASALEEVFHGDRARAVEPAAADPVLEAIQVERLVRFAVNVVEAAFRKTSN